LEYITGQITIFFVLKLFSVNEHKTISQRSPNGVDAGVIKISGEFGNLLLKCYEGLTYKSKIIEFINYKFKKKRE